MKKYLRERGDMVSMTTRKQFDNHNTVNNAREIIRIIQIFNFTLGHCYASC